MSKERTEKVLTHVSIEEQGRLWAKDYLSGEKCDLHKLVLVVPKKDARVMKLPPMMGENFALRLDDLGTIYHQRWRGINIKAVERTDDKWQLLYPRPDRVQADYLTDIPKHKTGVAVWQPVAFQTIESAIRAQGHVIDKVVSGSDHSDLLQADRVIKVVDELADAVLSGNLKDGCLDSLSQRTEEFLIENRLIDVQASRKVMMSLMLQKAFDKDSLNRTNPLVMRTRLRSAFLQATRQLVFVSKVAEKYTTNKVQLEYEREMTRWALKEAGDLLKRKIEAHAGFRKQGEESYRQRQILEKIIIEEISHGLLMVPRVKPYLAAARLAGIALIGCQPEYLETNSMIIDDESKLAWLISQDSVAQMVASNRFPEANKRVEEIKALIDNVLQ
ncbi:hypothetical protein L6272_06205 [Microgenomates group bacterium]|nr:hypothetical protein [Microgenomates group bacterium]